MVFFTLLGAATATFLLYKFVTALWQVFYPHVLAKFLGHTLDLKKLGKWAVVTGATDGIGRGYAKELARRGVNVFLISRSEEKLKSTAEEIRKVNSNVEVRTLSVDFSKATADTYRTTVATALKDLDIGVLVNNVGTGYTYPEELHKVDGSEEFLQNLILVNTASAVQMSHLVIPCMLEKSKGAIINISSASAFSPIPLLTVYSATKIFLEYLGAGLKTEYANSGIFFQVVSPFYVVTKLSGLSRKSFWAPDPDVYAANALDTVGLVNETSGCFSHELQRVGLKLLLSVVPASKTAENAIETMKKVRASYHRKQERLNNGKQVS